MAALLLEAANDSGQFATGRMGRPFFAASWVPANAELPSGAGDTEVAEAAPQSQAPPSHGPRSGDPAEPNQPTTPTERRATRGERKQRQRAQASAECGESAITLGHLLNMFLRVNKTWETALGLTAGGLTAYALNFEPQMAKCAIALGVCAGLGRVGNLIDRRWPGKAG
jgi:hypothetical protein